MTRTLAVIADRVDARSIEAVVVAQERLGETLTRLVVSSPAFATATTDPCDVTAFRVTRHEFRHYTPAILDQEARELTIIVHRHGSGPGLELIDGWSVGDEVRVCRWSSSRGFRWEAGDAPVVVLGDATVISLAMAVQRRAESEQRETLIVLEVEPGDVDATRSLVPGAAVVPAAGEPGASVDTWLREHDEAIVELDAPVVYLAGHGQSIQRQRAFLRETCGLDRRQVRTQPYWATGKTGL